MQTRASVSHINNVDAVVERMLDVARVPGAAIAVVQDGQKILSRGYGYRNAEAKLALTPDTVYPIASTTKAINATLIGMLVEEGKLAWDAPVRTYLPNFRLMHPAATELATLRDLLVMRTGLPRHDFLWIGNEVSREDMVDCLAYLPLSADFRERFQYNNLTSTLAGHLAEVVTGERWENLIRHRLFEPLGMDHTSFELPSDGDVTLSYHENHRRELVVTPRLEARTIGPAGGSIHSTVNDMSRWLAFNLNGGTIDGQQLIRRETLSHMQSPHVIAGSDATAPSQDAAYGLGWFIDTYNGRSRITHSGNLHGVSSCVMLFPGDGLGLVSFVNFSTYRFAQLIGEHVFDSIMGFEPVIKPEESLARYERNVEESRARAISVRRVEKTRPSHSLSDYAGSYANSGYGRIEILCRGEILCFKRNNLILPLEHWHYDAWVIAENDIFENHKWQPWERSNRIVFETSADGVIVAFTMRVESAVQPARFAKEGA